VKRRTDLSTGELDVVELLAEDDDDDIDIRIESDGEPNEPLGPGRRRWIAVGVVVVVVALVAYSFSTGEDPQTDEAASTPATTAAPPPTTTAPTALPPEVEAGPFLDSLDSRFALTRRGDVLVLDPTAVATERIPGVSGNRVAVVGAANGSLLLSDNDRHFVVEPDSNVVALDDVTVFPAVNGLGWWRADDGVLRAIGFAAEPVQLPPDTVAVTAVRTGFVLRFEDNPWGLSVWTPGSEPIKLPNSSAAVVAAVHPDRVAWFGSCLESSCDLQITDLASSRTIAVPGVLPLFSPGVAAGKFSADGTRLAVRVSSDQIVDEELIVVDLASGTVMLREPLGAGSTSPTPTPPFLWPAPFDFTSDGERMVLVDDLGSRLLQTVDLATGRREEANDELRAVTSVVNLDRVWSVPPSPLADRISAPVGVLIALVDVESNRVDLIDTANGTRRAVDMSELDLGDGFARGERRGPMIVAVTGGFVVGDGAQATWIPIEGVPLRLGPAQLLMSSAGRERAWLFTAHEDDSSYDVMSIDGITGEARTEDPVHTLPEAIVGDEFLRTIPASFDQAPRLESWNTRTGARRELDAGSAGMSMTATEHHILWQDEFCYESSHACSLHAVEVATGERVDLDVNASTWGTNKVAGDIAYLQNYDGALIRVDAEAGTFGDVPGATQVNQWAVAPSETVVFDQNGVLYAWTPGLPTAVRLAPTSRNGTTLIAAL